MHRKLWWGLLGFLSVVILGSLLVHAVMNRSQAAAQDVRVIDGDTLQINGKVVQIYGIDAPELGQLCYHGDEPWPCGLEAAFALHKLIELAREPVRCAPAEGSTDEAEVCEIGNEVIAEVLARQGHVVALKNGVAEYQQAQDAAREAGLGIWGGEFMDPARWRAGERLKTGSAETERCNIKGLLRNGKKIYYVPLDPGYESLQVDSLLGDRLFCSDDKASKLGWKHVGEK